MDDDVGCVNILEVHIDTGTIPLDPRIGSLVSSSTPGAGGTVPQDKLPQVLGEFKASSQVSRPSGYRQVEVEDGLAKSTIQSVKTNGSIPLPPLFDTIIWPHLWKAEQVVVG